MQGVSRLTALVCVSHQHIQPFVAQHARNHDKQPSQSSSSSSSRSGHVGNKAHAAASNVYHRRKRSMRGFSPGTGGQRSSSGVCSTMFWSQYVMEGWRERAASMASTVAVLLFTASCNQELARSALHAEEHEGPGSRHRSTGHVGRQPKRGSLCSPQPCLG